MSGVPYPLAHGCDATLNAWCDANCPHSTAHGSLLARHDLGSGAHQISQWRCYARSTLDKHALKYMTGTEYCSRHTQLVKVLQDCISRGTSTVTVDVTGGARRINPAPAHLNNAAPQRPIPSPSRPLSRRPLDFDVYRRVPSSRRVVSGTYHHYAHDPQYLSLPASLQLPRLEDCSPELTREAKFWAASLYTISYEAKAQRLVESCEKWGVCCRPALMPEGALSGVDGVNKEGSYALRHRLIASKPIFILSVLRQSTIPLAWLDVDLEFHSFPTLFTPDGWLHVAEPRDVILWNWQSNVSAFGGRRLKMASGVAWFNKTEDAEALLLAWSEAMAYEPNARAPDDQVMDLLVKDDCWIDRAAFGWLPESYLRMMPRHAHIEPVIDHDRGGPVSGKGKNSPLKPELPPRI